MIFFYFVFKDRIKIYNHVIKHKFFLMIDYKNLSNEKEKTTD